jgi:hypothetical protein
MLETRVSNKGHGGGQPVARREGCGRGTKRSKPIELFGICLGPALVLFRPPSMRCELFGCPTCFTLFELEGIFSLVLIILQQSPLTVGVVVAAK